MRGARIPPLVSRRTPFLRASLVTALVATAQPLAARDLARLRKVTARDVSPARRHLPRRRDLRRALTHLRAFAHVLRSHRARRTLPAPLLSTLSEQAGMIRADMEAIRF
jgi:hypothetical protein